MAALTCTVRGTSVLCTSENFANVRPVTNPISAGAAAAAADSRLSGSPAHETSQSDERAARVSITFTALDPHRSDAEERASRAATNCIFHEIPKRVRATIRSRVAASRLI
jgi:hypothetical protein